MTDGMQEQRDAGGVSWGGPATPSASGRSQSSGRRSTASSPDQATVLQFTWRPDAQDFPQPLSDATVVRSMPRTGDNPYAPLAPFEFPFQVHEEPSRTPIKVIPPIFAIIVVVGAFLSRDHWLPGSGQATATIVATQTSVPEADEPSLLTEVSGTGSPTTVATEPAATATTDIFQTATTASNTGTGFDPGLVTAAQGDTLIDIANAIGLNVSTLVWANDIEDPGAPLDEGTLVVVPPADGVLHTVTDTDSLASIATTYGVDPSVITGVEENGITSDLDVHPGMVLFIPGATLPCRASTATYAVREGDNLWGIADYYGLNPFTLAWANDLQEPFVIQVDQELIIPPADGIYVLAAEGDTVESIAAEYNVDPALIRELPFNQLQDPFAEPKVGEPIMIPSLDALVSAWDSRTSTEEATPESTESSD